MHTHADQIILWSIIMFIKKIYFFALVALLAIGCSNTGDKAPETTTSNSVTTPT